MPKLVDRRDSRPTAAAASARLEARVTPETLTLLKRAADLESSSLSSFVVAATKKVAHEVIERESAFRLSAKAQATFADALLAPARPNEALKRAFALHKKLVKG